MIALQVILFGASDNYSGDAVMQITVAFNHFGGQLVPRMPRVRWGYVHVVNNDHTNWCMVINHGNLFVAPPEIACKEVRSNNFNYILLQFPSTIFLDL